MKYYFYRTTNLINGKYYQGVHHSKDPEKDSYFGSGPGIAAAVKKYGRENFKVEILRDDFNSMREAYEYEASVITLDSLDPQVCYNQVPGGKGIQDGVITMSLGDQEIRVHQKLQTYYEGLGWTKGRSQKARNNSGLVHRGKPSAQKGKVYVHLGTQNIRIPYEDLQEYLHSGYIQGMSEEAKQKVRASRKGKRWYNNGLECRSFSEEETIPQGFVLGRLPRSQKHCQSISRAMKGKKDSEETRNRKRLAKQGRHWTLVNGKRIWSK